MNIYQAWDFFSFHKKREILVACGVNNSIHLCKHSPSSVFLPNCGGEDCDPCKANGSAIPYSITEEETVWQVTEPHAVILANGKFSAIPDILKKKIVNLLNSI